jgi:tripeptide aminopeptidase
MSTLLDRFVRYCRIDTQAVEGAPTYPSSPGQLELGELLVRELHDIGLADAAQDEYGIVLATIPATARRDVPVIAWLAHKDTSPETSGKGVKPVVHKNYNGRDIVLSGDPSKVLRVADTPELAAVAGKTVITTDGTTLLGADNKAGVAVIMEAAKYLVEHPEIEHGPVRVCFTCDEEVGHGVDHIDLKKLGAVVGYTLDGSGTGEIEGETFSADKATVTIRGVNIHPSIGKGKMVNAIRLAGMFLDRLPRARLSPETTEGREGFLHPYTISGGVAEVTIQILLRDFDTPQLAVEADLLRATAKQIEAEYPAASVAVEVTKQYRNMADGMKAEPRAVAYAEEAMRRAGLTPRIGIIRGGTDGSRLTELGLPTPNLSTGEHNLHSPLEWTCLEEMEVAVKVLVELAQVWAQGGPGSR